MAKVCLAFLLLALFCLPCCAQTPLSYFEVFYQNLLEFSASGPMTVNGLVHCNTNIYVGTVPGSMLTFAKTVSTTGLVLAPPNDGLSFGDPTNYNSDWHTLFNGIPNIVTNMLPLATTLDAFNPHEIIDPPPLGEDPNNFPGSVRLFNQAQILLLISNVSPLSTNVKLNIIIQKAPGPSQLPGADPDPITFTFTNPTPNLLAASNLSFLSLTNRFYDGREEKTNLTTQIDLVKYGQWLTNAASPVVKKYRADGSGGYPTILYVADNRNTDSHQLTVVRLANGMAPPRNGGFGFSVATPNPLYVLGSYNCNPEYVGTTNTTETVPCAFYCDAITVLSSNWSDADSLQHPLDLGEKSASDTTVNAAIVAGIVPSTGFTVGTFSGGVDNQVRLLEDWAANGASLTLNTAFINLFNSTRANSQFMNPGVYYFSPTRNFHHDLNFQNPKIAPPGMPETLLSAPLVFNQPQTLHEPLDVDIFNATVTAAGYGSLSYRWSFNGTNIDGATNSSLTLTNLRQSDTSGDYTVTVTDGIATNTAPIVHVVLTPTAPVISKQPLDQAALVGSNVVFSAVAAGIMPMFWQWQFNGTNIDGATNSTLVLTNVIPGQAGIYSVFITNSVGPTLSGNANLSVYLSATPMIDFFSRTAGNQVQFTVNGVPGLNYVVQASSNLVDWDFLVTNVSPFQFVDTKAANLPQRFYRASYLP